jgi:hypothetical protein
MRLLNVIQIQSKFLILYEELGFVYALGYNTLSATRNIIVLVIKAEHQTFAVGD